MSIQALEKRGIGVATQTAFGIKQSGNGFAYDTLNATGQTRERWKNASSEAIDGQKYRWADNPNGKGAVNDWHYYVLRPADLKAAVAAANGLLYWCAGEVDVWTLHSVGKNGHYPPASSAFGEKNIDTDLITFLREYGVTTLRYYPDLDKPGYEAAAKLYGILKDSGIVLELYALPGEMGSKTDLNALWQQANFDRAAFWTALSKCERIEDIQIYGDAPVTEYAEKQNAGLQLPDEYYAAIAGALGAAKYVHNGFSRLVRCPFHDDAKPSASWHKDKHLLHCFTCGRSYGAKDTAAKVGVDYRRYLPAQPERRETPRLSHATTRNDGTAAIQQQPALKVVTAPESAPDPMQDVVTSADLLSAYQQAVDPAAPAAFVPTIVPFTVLHRFGGFARFLPVGKMVFIAAQTGGNKTVFLETIADGYIQLGEDVVIYSPEWTPEEVAFRMGARHGGATVDRMFEHQVWKHYRQSGEESPIPVYGLNQDEMRNSNTAILSATPFTAGERYVIKKARLTLDQLLQNIEALVTSLRKQGRKTRVLILDYLQMLRMARQYAGKLTISDMVGDIKDLTMDLGLVTWAATQVTKDSSRQRNGSGKMLDENSAQFVRFDECNLGLTLNMNYYPEGHKYAGKHDGTADLACVKNSLGSKGKITVKTDLKHLTWLDEEYLPNAPYNDIDLTSL